jgi:hypothetical protein
MPRKPPGDREELDHHVTRVARQFKAISFVSLTLTIVLFLNGVIIGIVRAVHGIK